MCPIPVTSKKHHAVIDVIGGIVYLNGREVRIVVNVNTRDLTIGCTHITRAALCRIMELSATIEIGNEKVLQAGRP